MAGQEKNHSISRFQKTLCIWGYLVITQDRTNLYFCLFPEVHPGGWSCRKQNWARWTVYLIQYHMSHVCGWHWAGPCSGCGERSASGVEPNKPPWALGPANNQKWKCEEMDQSSSIADKKGRNLGWCNAFTNAKLWRDAESKPSQQWNNVAPNSAMERCVNYST